MVEQQPPQPLFAPLDQSQGGGAYDHSTGDEASGHHAQNEGLSDAELLQGLTMTRSAIAKLHTFTLNERQKFAAPGQAAEGQVYTPDDIHPAFTPPLDARYAQVLPLFATALALLDEQVEGREVPPAFFQETLNPMLHARGLQLVPRPQEGSSALENSQRRLQTYVADYTSPPPPMPLRTQEASAQAQDVPADPARYKAVQPYLSLVFETSRWARMTMYHAGDPRTASEVTNPLRRRSLEAANLFIAAQHILEENTDITVEEPPGKRWRIGIAPTGIDMATVVYCLNDALQRHNLMVDVLPAPIDHEEMTPVPRFMEEWKQQNPDKS